MNLRKSYAQNRLARSMTGGGNAPLDIDVTMSQSKQELHSAIAMSIEGMKPVFDDDYEVEELVEENEQSDAGDQNCNHVTKLFEECGDEFNGFTADELRFISEPANENLLDMESISVDASTNLIGTDSTSASNLATNDTTSTNSISTRRASMNSDSSKPIKETLNMMRSTPSTALLRSNRKMPRKKAMTVAQDDTMQAAKRLFYENEELRAAERHKIQLIMWEEERERKKVEHEKRLQLYDARIALLRSHSSPGEADSEATITSDADNDIS